MGRKFAFSETNNNSSGARFTEHLKPKIFVTSLQSGSYKNFTLKMFSEMRKPRMSCKGIMTAFLVATAYYTDR